MEAQFGFSVDLLTEADRRLQPRSASELSQRLGHIDRALYNEALADAEIDALFSDARPKALASRFKRAKAKERLADEALSRLDNGYLSNLLFDAMSNDSVEALAFFSGAKGAQLGVKGLQAAVDGVGVAGAGALAAMASLAALFPDEAEAVARPRLKAKRDAAAKALGRFLQIDMPPGTGLYAEVGGHHLESVVIYAKARPKPGRRSTKPEDYVMAFSPDKGFAISNKFMREFEDPAELAAVNARRARGQQPLMPGDLVHGRITRFQREAYDALRRKGIAYISRAEHNRIALEALISAGVPLEMSIQLLTVSNRIFREARKKALHDPAIQARFKQLNAIADPKERLRAMQALKLDLRVWGRFSNPAKERIPPR